MASGDTKTEAMLNILGNGGSADAYRGCCNTKTQSYILDAIDRVQAVEDEVDELKNNPDVVDIVATYQDLEDYDTSTLTDKDIIRVLSDSTHSGDSTFYRWDAANNEFDFIGYIPGSIPNTIIDTIWFGTQDQYDAIGTKAEKTLYLVKEETTPANTLSASPAVLNLPKINLGNTNILDNVDNITPEEEIEEPEEEIEEPEEEIEEEEPEELEEEIEEPEEIVEEPEEIPEETNTEEE